MAKEFELETQGDSKPRMGHARDCAEMQWLKLQQEKVKYYVIATDEQNGVRDCINIAGKVTEE